MKRTCIGLVLLWMCVTIAGCGSNPSKTQRPDLLDDKVTAGRVEAALHRGGPVFNGVSVRASGGEVTLSGEVKTQHDKSHAEEIARKIKRVRDVQDDIEVKP